jgi:hypothetical protein
VTLSLFVHELLDLAFRRGYRAGRRNAHSRCSGFHFTVGPVTDKRHGCTRFDFTVGPVSPKSNTTMPLALKLTTEQKALVTIKPVTAGGKPAALDSVPVWSVNSGSVTLAPAQDGLSCFILAGDAGASEVDVTAEGDMVPGVDTVSDIVTVTVTQPEAASLGLTAAAPVLQ